MKVQDPSGQTWRVTRRWAPWRRRLKDLDGLDVGSGLPDVGGMDDPIGCLVVGVLGFLFAPIILLSILVAAEFLLLLLLLPLAVLARVAFGKQWTVEARRGFTIVWDEPAGDWQESAIRIHEVADALRKGVTLSSSPGVHPHTTS